MKRTTLFIDETLESDLRALAKRQGRAVASLVREAVEQYVIAQTRGHRRGLSFIGVGRSGSRDTAEHHERMLFREPETHVDPGHPAARRPSRKRAPRSARARP